VHGGRQTDDVGGGGADGGGRATTGAHRMRCMVWNQELKID
jgi:hypothetical protein